jgi:hypothetical protein
MGVANGVATLDSTGKVPATQLPSYVDDIIEGTYSSSTAFYTNTVPSTLITPETGKIYVDLTTNKTYRWSGSAYVVVSETLALGETASTAYPGNKGKANAENIATNTAKIAENAAKIKENADDIAELNDKVTALEPPKYTAYTGKPSTDQTPAFGGKVTISQVTTNNLGHVTNMTARTTTIPSNVATETVNGLMSAVDKKKLNTIAEGAEVNQEAFGNVKINNTNIAATTEEDTITFKSGSNVQLTVSGKEVTISSTDTNNTYEAGAGLELLNNKTFAHTNTVVGSTASGDADKTLTAGSTFKVPSVTYDNQGHITSSSSTTMTMPSTMKNPTSLTVKGAGSEVASYDGSVAKSIDIVAGNDNITVTTANGQIKIASKDTNNTYDASNGIKLDGSTFKHTNAVSAGTAKGSDSKTLAFGGTFTIPTVTYDAQGHVTTTGTTTMTMPANPNSDTKNTTGSTNTDKKIYLVGAETQATNPVTYSHDTIYVDTDGRLYQDGVEVATHGSGFYYVAGAANGTAGVWTGTHNDITEYYDGLMIAYKVGTAGKSGGTTLNINGLGAISVVHNVTTAVSTHYGINSVVLLVYTRDSSANAYWKVVNYYDSNTKNTAGTTNKVGTKLFLAGATSQAENP